MAESISSVGVVGCGTMGSGICETVAGHGLDVHFVEIDAENVELGHERIRGALERQVARGRIAADRREEILDRISGGTDLDALADCDFVVEAIPEDLERKQEVFAKIDAVTRDDAIVATNTSSLPVMDIAVHTRRPNRVLGFHFFNPAPVMELIELVRTVVTDEAALNSAREFAEAIGKSPVVCGDRRGFIANQLLFPYLNQAAGMVETGYATKEDIDAAMRLGAGLPMGPIALMDLVGLDTMVAIMDAIHEQFGDPRFAPRPILRQLVSAGYTGRKAGRGFYTYEEPGSSVVGGGGSERPPADPDRVASWSRVGILGTGTMATGITEVCARSGYDVVVRGRSREKAERVAAGVSKSLQRLVDKERLGEEAMVEALANVHPTPYLDDLGDCDIVIEAVAEDLAVKQGLFAELGPLLDDGAVLATTTSSLSVIECAMATDQPEQVLGLHFFNPAPIMGLVEIAPTVRTAAAVVERARAFVADVGKSGVLCDDRAGFIVNALLFPYLNDAVRMLSSHYATVEEIDTAMRLGCNYPLGPFELMDIVGLDVTLAIIEALHEEFREPSYEPDPLLRHLVATEFLGRKAGRGFYVYD